LTDVPTAVAKALHESDESDATRPWDELDEKTIGRKRSRAKTRLNDAVAATMTVEQIREMAGEEMETWLRTVGELADAE
jgi:hypothetical protein